MNDYKLKPYQEALITAIQNGGIKCGEMMIMSSGRQTGKSVLNAAYGRLFNDIYYQPLSDLILSEGRVYGARYYCVQPIGGNWKEMELWCTETFGSTAGSIWADDKTPEPAERWYMNNRKFWFRTEKDRNWFTLRWSK